MIVNRKKEKPSTEKTHHIYINDKIYHYSDSDKKRFDSNALDNYRRRAKKLSVPYTLTAESLRDWWLTTPDVCTYCDSTVTEYLKMSMFIMQYTGNAPTIIRFKNAFNLPNHQSIAFMTKDRIDNSKGYTIDNLCKACWLCNYLRGRNFTSDEWKLIAPMIMKKLKAVCL
ncbi:hypothetical protein LCGC14_2978780 [marine sediment metagenome]|uniref:Uncharacterized protein n=1 Tax=marine sediment metagenome TaxID=412755 RepID=A0A0F8X841_9ZZZZ